MPPHNQQQLHTHPLLLPPFLLAPPLACLCTRLVVRRHTVLLTSPPPTPMINCTRCAPVLPVSRLYEKHRPKHAVCLCVRLSLSLPFLAPSLSLSLAVGDGQRREKSPPPPIPRVVPMVNARRPGIKNVSPTNQFLKKIVLYKRSVSCGRVLASVPCRERLFRLNPNSTWLSSPSCFRHGSLRISRRSGEGGVAKHAYHKTIQQKAAGGRGSDARSARSTDAEPQPLFERTSPNAAQLYRVCCLVVTISKTGPQVFVREGEGRRQP